MFLGLLHTLCAQVIKDIFRNKYIENIQTLSEYSMFFAFNNQIDTKMKRIATQQPLPFPLQEEREYQTTKRLNNQTTNFDY